MAEGHPKRKRIVAVACFIVLAGLCFGYRHVTRQNMISCTLEWGRLAPFPDDARKFTIETEGGFFTRAFRASFRADPKTIEAWINTSPGLQDAESEKTETGLMKYIIQPGGGAQYAEIEIDDRSNIVKVYVSWS